MPTAVPRVTFRSITRIAVLMLATALVFGCAQTPTRSTGPTEASSSASREAIREAARLAAAAATQTGAQRHDTEAQIDRLLIQLDDAALQQEAGRLAADDPLYSYVGRALLRRGLPLPHAFARGWNFDNRPPAERDGYRPPVKLAVLLPLSGSLSVAARPVRDGFLAGYYGETRRRPDVRFYDTAGTPAGAMSAYDRATADGNDFVVGPLGRDEVSALFGRAELGVPMLALNRGTQSTPKGQSSFSLSPEDEGLAAADYLTRRNARNVLVVAAGDDTQRRAVASFRERLTARGGTVVAVADDDATDFAPVVAGKQVDAVFIATKGNTARLVVPRLSTAGLGGKPRVATSQIVTGTGKADDDRVLDGIAFPSESWLTRSVHGLSTAEATGARLPSAKGPAGRLFAFGFDAWLLTAYLDSLGHQADASVDGATGVLRLDGFGNVQRTPAWSTFATGDPAPLADAAR
ncbi:penicillin-binding protein activator [Cognatilysobacter terrigena]|uniref:penicillin-binding protein activator n=1 Tax=Cognatilysobacter terrigena TaxID=2488749 RepID=UPI001FED1A32|nr:penicillin-binding protein activator [Lysobacter terrigena]